jgi:ParB family chromosome partitioning protein
LAQIDARIAALTDATEVWTPETLACSGAVIGLDHDGEIRIERNLVRKEDARKLRRKDAEPGEQGPSRSILPAKLVADLTAQGDWRHTATAAGYRARCRGAALDTLYLGCAENSALEMSAKDSGVGSAMAARDACPALQTIERERVRLGDILPPPEDLFAWCLARSQDELLALLAFIAATSVNAVQAKGDHAASSRLAHAEQLANALALDMRSWFVPGAENYFGRINRHSRRHRRG